LVKRVQHLKLGLSSKGSVTLKTSIHYEIGLAIATRQEDGMVLFSCNVGMPELYILLDQIKMYIISGEDYEQELPH
jgi:hypothetical protein